MNEILHSLGVSTDTVFISIVIAAVGWLLKQGIKLLIDAVSKLIETLINTMAEVKSFRSELTDIKTIMGQVPKLQTDMNEFYKRLKNFEEQLKPKN